MTKSISAISGIVLFLCAGVVAQAQPEQAIYGIDIREDALIKIDPATGAAEKIGDGLGFDVITAGVDFACDGTLWGFSQTRLLNPSENTLYTVDLTTGVASRIQIFDTTGFADHGVGFEFGPDESSFFWRNGLSLHRLDVDTGTIIQGVGTFENVSYSFTVAPDCDGFLSTEDTGTLTRVDTNGNRTVIGETGLVFPPRITSLASSPDGKVYGHRGGFLYDIDPNTAQATLIGQITDGTNVFRTAGMAVGPEVITCSVCPFRCPPTLSFEKDAEGSDLLAGTVIDDEYAAHGITITTNNPNDHPAMIFDSSSPTCGDQDLGTPNSDFSGPGIGTGGGTNKPGRNVLPRGNVLIISEDFSCTPDDKAGGGTLSFTFDEPVPLVTEVHILDVEEDEGEAPTFTVQSFDRTADDGPRSGSCNAKVTAFDIDGFQIVSMPILGLGNNSFQVVPLGAMNVSSLEVKLCGSGAVSAVVFCGDCGANFFDSDSDSDSD